MKKILILMVALTMVIGSQALFAEVTKQNAAGSVLIDWVFAPAVSTYAGFNLDTNVLGLEGKATLDLKSTIRKKANEEFGKADGDNAGTAYGYIQVKDLEIKIATGTKNSKYDSTKTSDEAGDPNKDNAKTSPLAISLGAIEGVIYMGPVYINLKHTAHNDQEFVNASGLDKDGMTFSAIGYSVIPTYTTANYMGNTLDISFVSSRIPAGASEDIIAAAAAAVDAVAASDLYKSSIVTFDEDGKPSGSIATTFETGNLGASSIGFKQDGLLDVRVGVSTKYSYKQVVPNNYKNPISLSLYFDLLAVENLTLKVAATANMNVNNNPIMYDGNPVTAGLLVGYKIGHITPYVGAEFRLEKNHMIDPYSPIAGGAIAVAEKMAELTSDAADTVKAGTAAVPAKYASIKDNKYIAANSYQVAVGVTYDWADKGISNAEGDHLAFAPKDEKATDGVSLGLIYGSTPHRAFREAQVPFLGAKIALWESEATDKPGMIPGLQAGLVVNYNIAMGTKYTHKVDQNPHRYKGEYIFGQRHDLGLGFEASYTLGFIKPHAGILYKAFDILKGKDTLNDSAENLRKATAALDSDLRVKVGVDLTQIVKNTTLKLWWESGNLIKKSSYGDPAKDNMYADNAFYTNNVKADNGSSVIFTSPAKLGYIAIGAKIKF